MSKVEENKAVILRGFEEEWNKGNLDVIPEIFTTDLVCHMVHFPDIHGQDEWRSFVISFRNAFPDIHFKIEDHFGEKDKVATRWTCSVTNNELKNGGGQNESTPHDIRQEKKDQNRSVHDEQAR